MQTFRMHQYEVRWCLSIGGSYDLAIDAREPILGHAYDLLEVQDRQVSYEAEANSGNRRENDPY